MVTDCNTKAGGAGIGITRDSTRLAKAGTETKTKIFITHRHKGLQTKGGVTDSVTKSGGVTVLSGVVVTLCPTAAAWRGVPLTTGATRR